MWLRPVPSPCDTYKQDLMKLDLQMVSFASDTALMLAGACLSVNGSLSLEGVD